MLSPRRQSEIPGQFYKLFWVTIIITIIKMRSISTDYSQNLQQKVSFCQIVLSLIVSNLCILPFDI